MFIRVFKLQVAMIVFGCLFIFVFRCFSVSLDGVRDGDSSRANRFHNFSEYESRAFLKSHIRIIWNCKKEKRVRERKKQRNECVYV